MLAESFCVLDQILPGVAKGFLLMTMTQECFLHFLVSHLNIKHLSKISTGLKQNCTISKIYIQGIHLRSSFRA